MEPRERNLYRHWAVGLGTELAVFAGLLAVLAGLALLVAGLVR